MIDLRADAAPQLVNEGLRPVGLRNEADAARGEVLGERLGDHAAIPRAPGDADHVAGVAAARLLVHRQPIERGVGGGVVRLSGIAAVRGHRREEADLLQRIGAAGVEQRAHAIQLRPQHALELFTRLLAQALVGQHARAVHQPADRAPRGAAAATARLTSAASATSTGS